MLFRSCRRRTARSCSAPAPRSSRSSAASRWKDRASCGPRCGARTPRRRSRMSRGRSVSTSAWRQGTDPPPRSCPLLCRTYPADSPPPRRTTCSGCDQALAADALTLATRNSVPAGRQPGAVGRVCSPAVTLSRPNSSTLPRLRRSAGHERGQLTLLRGNVVRYPARHRSAPRTAVPARPIPSRQPDPTSLRPAVSSRPLASPRACARSACRRELHLPGPAPLASWPGTMNPGA